MAGMPQMQDTCGVVADEVRVTLGTAQRRTHFAVQRGRFERCGTSEHGAVGASRPTICSPTGKPSGEKPHGTLIAGAFMQLTA